jgi:hypothetical protein
MGLERSLAAYCLQSSRLSVATDALKMDRRTNLRGAIIFACSQLNMPEEKLRRQVR